jgi:DNA-binding transcriptional regulator LsrR (DeoR family)
MYFNQGMRQVDIVKHFNCSKGTISGIIKKLKSLK